MSRIHFMPVIAILAAPQGLSAQTAEHQHRRAHPRYKT